MEMTKKSLEIDTPTPTVRRKGMPKREQKMGR
jgi:hypothetical protein